MKKRILTLSIALMLVMLQIFAPIVAYADTTDNQPSSYGYDETPAEKVTVEVTISNDGIPLRGLDKDDTKLADLEVTVPYFDLELYGLQQYYRYETENGQGKYVNDKVVERPTALHLYIYLLERYYFGLPEEDCGKGEDVQKVLNVSDPKTIYYYDGNKAYDSMKDGAKYNSLTLTGSPTSMYMFNFWGHDENLMYYRNHRYPLMSPGWGSCADYILLSEGDRIEVAMFTNWSFYHTGAFLSFDKDEYAPMPGEPLTVQVRGTATSPKERDTDTDNDGVLTPEDVKDNPETPILPYTENDIDVALYNEDWERSEAEVTNNGDGTYTIQVPRRVGTYYVMASDAYYGTDEADKSPGIAKVVVYDEKVAFELKKEDAKDEIEWYVDLDDYRTEQQKELEAIMNDACAQIDAVTSVENVDDLDQIVASAKKAMDGVKTNEQMKEAEEAAEVAAKALASAKASAKKELSAYKKASDYRDAQKAELAALIEATNKAIEAATSEDAVKKEVTEAKAAMDIIKTDAQLKAEEEANKPVLPTQLKNPANVKTSNVAKTGKVKVSWNKVEGAAKYQVYRATKKNGKYTLVKTVTGTIYTDSSTKVGKSFYFKVKAVSDDQNVTASTFSKAVKGTVDLKMPVVTAKSKTKKQVKLTWKKVSSAKKYEIYRATKKNGKYKKIATTTKLSYTNKKLKSGKTYYYKVKAIAKKAAYNSAFSTVDKCRVK